MRGRAPHLPLPTPVGDKRLIAGSPQLPVAARFANWL